MYLSIAKHTLAAKTRVIALMLLLTVFISQAASAAFQIKGCNSNGTYSTYGFVSSCIDPDSGLRVSYLVYYRFAWTTSGVQHLFNIVTDQNTSNGYGPGGGVLCGPADTPSGTALASDGSRFYMVVDGYYQATIYDPNGNMVFQFGEGTICQ